MFFDVIEDEVQELVEALKDASDWRPSDRPIERLVIAHPHDHR